MCQIPYAHWGTQSLFLAGRLHQDHAPGQVSREDRTGQAVNR